MTEVIYVDARTETAFVRYGADGIEVPLQLGPSDWSVSMAGPFDTLVEMLWHFEGSRPYVPEPGDVQHEKLWAIEEDRDGVDVLTAIWLIDAENMNATDKDVEAWKRGDLELWRVWMEVKVHFVTRRYPDEGELQRHWKWKDRDPALLGTCPSAWRQLSPVHRSDVEGWSVSGEFHCHHPGCDVSIGRNLMEERPHALAIEHLASHEEEE